MKNNNSILKNGTVPNYLEISWLILIVYFKNLLLNGSPKFRENTISNFQKIFIIDLNFTRFDVKNEMRAIFFQD